MSQITYSICRNPHLLICCNQAIGMLSAKMFEMNHFIVNLFLGKRISPRGGNDGLIDRVYFSVSVKRLC